MCRFKFNNDAIFQNHINDELYQYRRYVINTEAIQKWFKRKNKNNEDDNESIYINIKVWQKRRKDKSIK